MLCYFWIVILIQVDLRQRIVSETQTPDDKKTDKFSLYLFMTPPQFLLDYGTTLKVEFC